MTEELHRTALRLWQRLAAEGLWEAVLALTPEAAIKLYSDQTCLAEAGNAEIAGGRAVQQVLEHGLILEIISNNRRQCDALLKVVAMLFADAAEQERIRRRLAAETLQEYRHSNQVQRMALALASATESSEIFTALLEHAPYGNARAILDETGNIVLEQGQRGDSAYTFRKRDKGVMIENQGRYSRLICPLAATGYTYIAVQQNKSFTSSEQQRLEILSGLAVAALEKLQQAGQITHLRRYFPRAIAQQIVEAGGDTLTGQEYTATILMADLCGFTALSRQLDPRATVQMLNQYFEEMVFIVRKHRGFVDKFIGDGLLAVFGIPTHTHHADDAVEAALEMLEAMPHLGTSIPLTMRAGISTGVVLSGNIGSYDRRDYTVIGNPVNEASKLLSVGRETGKSLLLTHHTHAHLGHELWQHTTEIEGQLNGETVYTV